MSILGAVRTTVRRLRGESLADIAQSADHDGVVHVAMQVFQDEGGLDGDAFQVGQHLRRLAAVVERLGILLD